MRGKQAFDQAYAPLLQGLLTAGSFTPCSLFCATGAASLSTYGAARTCSDGWSSSCAIGAGDAAVSVAVPTSFVVSRGSNAVAVLAGRSAAAFGASSRVVVAGEGIVVTGWRVGPGLALSTVSWNAQVAFVVGDRIYRGASVVDAAVTAGTL